MTFPENLKQREEYFLHRIQTEDLEFNWGIVTSEFNGHHAQFRIMDDALKLDGIRINVSAYLQQQIADFYDASLLTPKLADLRFDQVENRLHPHPRPISSTVEAMIKHNAQVDQELNGRWGSADPVGKYWCISNELINKPGLALNYGWHFAGSDNFNGIHGYVCDSKLKDPVSGQYYHVIQPSATAHDFKHSDYSQVCVLVKNECLVDGEVKRLQEVLTHRDLCGLASHEGVMQILRQPGVPAQTLFGS